MSEPEEVALELSECFEALKRVISTARTPREAGTIVDCCCRAMEIARARQEDLVYLLNRDIPKGVRVQFVESSGRLVVGRFRNRCGDDTAMVDVDIIDGMDATGRWPHGWRVLRTELQEVYDG